MVKTWLVETSSGDGSYDRLCPTLAELAGLPIPQDLHGTNLVPVLKVPDAKVKPGACSFAKDISYRVPDWHLMSYPDGTFELYDMQRDPHEFRNLARDPAYQSQFAQLQRSVELQ